VTHFLATGGCPLYSQHQGRRGRLKEGPSTPLFGGKRGIPRFQEKYMETDQDRNRTFPQEPKKKGMLMRSKRLQEKEGKPT